jgi:diadenosine tetraphosphate (Ap4A) HIT family hydrolase
VKTILQILTVVVLITILWFVPTTLAFIAKTLFNVALHPSMGKVVGWGFEFASPLLPVERVLLTDKTVAFYHPRPSWDKHILVIPRKQITTIFDLSKHNEYLRSVYNTAHEIFLSQGFDVNSYALVVNGGKRQDVNLKMLCHTLMTVLHIHPCCRQTISLSTN